MKIKLLLETQIYLPHSITFFHLADNKNKIIVMLDLEGELHTAPFLELNITVWKHFKYNLSLNV